VSKHPTGKGYFIWQLERCANGHPGRLAEQAQRAGLSWVAFKTHNGTATRNGNITPHVAALKAAGIECWGWGYCYGINPTGEADIALRRTHQFGLDGYFIDAEAEYKTAGARSKARLFIERMRADAPELPLGLCSYRYPSVHRELPWDVFLPACDFHAPQVYWLEDPDPAAPIYNLQRSYRELTALRALPFIPIGVCSPNDAGTWLPTSVQVDNFDRAARDAGLPGVGWWSWEHAERRLVMWSSISMHNWSTPTPPPIQMPMPRLSHDSGSRIGAHVLQPDAVRGLQQQLVAAGTHLAAVLAVENAGVLMELKALSPATATFWRLFTPGWDACDGIEGWSDLLIGEQAGRVVEYAAQRYAQLSPEERAAIDWIVLLNEADPPGVEGWRRFGRFIRQLALTATTAGLKIATPAFNFGTPEYDEWQTFIAEEPIEALVEGGHVLVIHEGVAPHGTEPLAADQHPIPGAPAVPMGAGNKAWRYRYFYDALARAHRPWPLLLVGEFYAGGGYSSLAEALLRHVLYDQQTARDPYVIGVCGFTMDPDASWQAQNYNPLYTSQGFKDYLISQRARRNSPPGSKPSVAPIVQEEGMVQYLLTVDDSVSIGELREKLGATRIFDARICVYVDNVPQPPSWDERIPDGPIARPWPLVKPRDADNNPATPNTARMYDSAGRALTITRSNQFELREKKTLPGGQVLFRVLDAPLTVGGVVWWVRVQDVVPV
jgi:hypothetical protein